MFPPKDGPPFSWGEGMWGPKGRSGGQRGGGGRKFHFKKTQGKGLVCGKLSGTVLFGKKPQKRFFGERREKKTWGEELSQDPSWGGGKKTSAAEKRGPVREAPCQDFCKLCAGQNRTVLGKKRKYGKKPGPLERLNPWNG